MNALITWPMLYIPAWVIFLPVAYILGHYSLKFFIVILRGWKNE